MVKQAQGVPFGQPKFFQGFVTLPVLCSIELAYRLPKLGRWIGRYRQKRRQSLLVQQFYPIKVQFLPFPLDSILGQVAQSTQNLLASSLMYQSILS